MKRIYPHFSGNDTQGIAFEVEDDSSWGDNTYLANILKAFLPRSTPQTWPTVKVTLRDGRVRTVTALGGEAWHGRARLGMDGRGLAWRGNDDN